MTPEGQEDLLVFDIADHEITIVFEVSVEKNRFN